MRQKIVLAHEFVEFIPDDLKQGTVYISMRFATVAHKCCCGCGQEVVTPLSPTDWKLIFDGKTISLHPSVGNWSFECRSHYWIRNNRVQWAAQWSQDEIDAGRSHDRFAKDRYFDTDDSPATDTTKETAQPLQIDKIKPSFWDKVKSWWKRS